MEDGRPAYTGSEIMPWKPVVWLGDSLARLREFPREAMREAGYQLERVQGGRQPKDCKPMTSVGSGVQELRIRMEGAFRILYVAKFAEAIYVLHAFRKKSRRTAPLDIQVARSRYRSLLNTRGSQ
jgi:phage-related protein